jgi:hypothetical protein
VYGGGESDGGRFGVGEVVKGEFIDRVLKRRHKEFVGSAEVVVRDVEDVEEMDEEMVGGELEERIQKQLVEEFGRGWDEYLAHPYHFIDTIY